jgi:hypothetical protein
VSLYAANKVASVVALAVTRRIETKGRIGASFAEAAGNANIDPKTQPTVVPDVRTQSVREQEKSKGAFSEGTSEKKGRG